jgi:hypothetical protein
MRHFFWILSQFFSTERVHQSCAQPPTKRNRSLHMSPTDRVAQLYPHATGSLFIAFYERQGYSGGIHTWLQAGNKMYISIILYMIVGYLEYWTVSWHIPWQWDNNVRFRVLMTVDFIFAVLRIVTQCSLQGRYQTTRITSAIIRA